MSAGIESRLRTHLADVDQAPVTDVGSVLVASERAGLRLRQRRRVAVAGAAGGLAVAVGIGLWSVRSGSPDTEQDEVSAAAPSVAPAVTPATSSSVLPASAWVPIAPDPRGPASRPSVVWTGTEAIVVGGLDPAGRPVPGAAAYEPASGSWRTLADPPAGSGRIDPLVAWTGREMLVIGGTNPDGSLLVSYGEAYEPEIDTWRSTASPPVGVVSDGSPAVWTGTELLVWPGSGGGSTTNVTPVAYDPEADTWTELPAPPIEARQQAASVWTGREWVVWGGTTGERELADGAAYSPSTESWRTLAAPPLSARRVRAVWTGSEMLVQAGSTGGDSVTTDGAMALSDGAAYDPTSDTWRELAPGLAHPGFVPVWTGEQMVMFAKGGAAVYDVASDRWIDTCCSETGDGGAARPVWTGMAILLAGSFDSRAGGALFTVPSSAG